MLKKWKLENFKSYKGQYSFDLAPLTILCGANSSGKSSLIQSILLVRQTIQDSPVEHPLSLNGPLVQLGTYEDICNNQAAKQNNSYIGLGWNLLAEEQEGAQSRRKRGLNWEGYDCDLVFDSNTQEHVDLDASLVPRLKSSRFVAWKNIFDGFNTHNEIVIERPKKARKLVESESLSPYSFLVKEVESTAKAEIRERTLVDFKILSASTWHFIPDALIVQYNEAPQIRLKKLRSIYGPVPSPISELLPNSLKTFLLEESDDLTIRDKRKLSDFLASDILYSDWSEYTRNLRHYNGMKYRQKLRELETKLERIIREDTQDKQVQEKFAYELGRDILRAHNQFFRFKIKYLGPLRDAPRAAYALQSSSLANDVGARGQRTAAVLNLFEKTKIEYVLPNGFVGDELEFIPKKSTLKEALIDWLKYLNIATGIQTKDMGKLGHVLQVQIGADESYHDLMNVGVGVSQLLPIMVMCLLAGKGETLILEQPELHLNPAVQTKLADFLISMMFLNKQCIIETHSEHIIERLRYRIAQEKNEKILSATKIFFFTKTKGNTKVQPVVMTKFGAITDWPNDFFDHSVKEAQKIMSAATKKRKNNPEN